MTGWQVLSMHITPRRFTRIGLYAQVRSSVDEEDANLTGEEGRFIETTASMPDATPGSTAEEHSTLQQSLEEDTDAAASEAETQTAEESKSMWQRLKGIGKQKRKVSGFIYTSLSIVGHHRHGQMPCTLSSLCLKRCACQVRHVSCIIKPCTVCVKMPLSFRWIGVLGNAALFWASLRGPRVLQRYASKGVGSEGAAEGQLNAGRILDRSRSSNDSTRDFSEQLFGSSRGVTAFL